MEDIVRDVSLTAFFHMPNASEDRHEKFKVCLRAGKLMLRWQQDQV